jgi:hypothetical protein
LKFNKVVFEVEFAVVADNPFGMAFLLADVADSEVEVEVEDGVFVAAGEGVAVVLTAVAAGVLAVRA